MPFLTLPDNRKLFFEARGNGSPLIFVHGWGTCGKIWKNQLDYLSKDHKTIAVDLAGHGQSSLTENNYTLDLFADDLIYLINSLKLEEPVLIGWSMGAMIAIKLCSKYKNIESLVFISGTPRFVSNYEFLHALPPLIIQKLKKDLNNIFKNFYYQMLKIEDNSKELLAFLEKEIPNPAVMVALKTLEELERADLRNLLGKIDLPTLLIHGRKDKICSPKASEYMAEKIKKSVLQIMPEAGHLPFLTEPEKFNSIVEEFLA